MREQARLQALLHERSLGGPQDEQQMEGLRRSLEVEQRRVAELRAQEARLGASYFQPR